jgi:hypothetical protein
MELVENDLLVVYFPPVNRALVFRVKAAYSGVYRYGPLPVTRGETLGVIGGGATAAPADGVLPGNSYTSEKTFPTTADVPDKSDLWYLKEDDRDRLFYLRLKVLPQTIRIEQRVPPGVSQAKLHKNRVSGGVAGDFGYTYGVAETIRIPKVRQTYVFANPLNFAVRTYAEFEYSELVVETPRDPGLIAAVLARKVPAKWFKLPMAVWDDSVESALLDVYGYSGFAVPPIGMEQAIYQQVQGIIGVIKR